MLALIVLRMLKDYNDAKKASDMVKAEKLYKDDKILEAANLGHPKAIGEMADNYVNVIMVLVLIRIRHLSLLLKQLKQVMSEECFILDIAMMRVMG